MNTAILTLILGGSWSIGGESSEIKNPPTITTSAPIKKDTCTNCEIGIQQVKKYQLSLDKRLENNARLLERLNERMENFDRKRQEVTKGDKPSSRVKVVSLTKDPDT